EPNEPPHKFGPATQSLWWKWTPAQSTTVRLKAVRYQQGALLEVFTGNALENLRPVADNRNTASRMGLSGVLRLRVKAGQTYYIRADQDSRLPRGNGLGAPGSSAADATFTVEPLTTPLPFEL